MFFFISKRIHPFRIGMAFSFRPLKSKFRTVAHVTTALAARQFETLRGSAYFFIGSLTVFARLIVRFGHSCHRANQNQPPMGGSKPATLRRELHITFSSWLKGKPRFSVVGVFFAWSIERLG